MPGIVILWLLAQHPGASYFEIHERPYAIISYDVQEPFVVGKKVMSKGKYLVPVYELKGLNGVVKTVPQKYIPQHTIHTPIENIYQELGRLRKENDELKRELERLKR